MYALRQDRYLNIDVYINTYISIPRSLHESKHEYALLVLVHGYLDIQMDIDSYINL